MTRPAPSTGSGPPASGAVSSGRVSSGRVSSGAGTPGPTRGGRWGGGAALAVVVLWSLHGVDPQGLADLDARGARALAGVLRPDLSAPVLADVGSAAVETVQIAVAGLVLSALAAAPLALLLAGVTRAARPVRAAVRVLAALLRGVPELVYALVFVAVVGLGPLAGTLAVAVHGAGLLAKLWAEQLESVDPRPVQAARLSGASRPAVLALAVLPLARPGLLSLLLYQLECNIRTATVLGIVGAGGLGQAIDLSLRLFDYAQLGTLVLAVLVLVLGVDALSRRIRSAVGADTRAVTG